jgi:hypothetical protein
VPKPTKTGAGPVLHQQISLQPPAQPEKQEPDDAGPDFWERLEQLTPEDWVSHEVHLYRRRPKVALQGLGGYLAKFQQAVTIDDIKHAFGGYDFEAMLKKDGKLAFWTVGVKRQ